MRACGCLNIIVETDSDDFQKVNVDLLELNEEFMNDNFFKQELQQVIKLKNINTVHAGLVNTRNVGLWTINRCINCDMNTHAVHKEKGASFVLINSKLLTNDMIANLRTSEYFSTTFNIVINTTELESDEKVVDTYLPPNVESVIKNLRQIMLDVLKKETLAVEERIQKFSEEQFDNLSNIKDRLFREQDVLSRVIRSTIPDLKPESTKSLSSPRVNEVTPRLKKVSTEFVESPDTDSESFLVTNTRHTPKRQKSSPGVPKQTYDTELLFDFEGADGEVTLTSDPEDSDRDEKEDVKVPRGRAASISIAKSLPMDIPLFMSKVPNLEHEDIDDYFPQEADLDIAASMKALAKSVHSESPFGELPRPRFSTQL